MFKFTHSSIRKVARISPFCLALALSLPAAGQHCPISYGGADDQKPNKLYLYFPPVDDSTYPNFGSLTSPAHRFDISELSSYSGTVGALENAIFNVVSEDYCEFNVQVKLTTAFPPTTFARRNTIAV